ncbi:DUF3043 domain-containing protein [Aeromicrobium sp. 636]|uniref:DUF3043 domain-containing protein n=1 Tax=Aeromicrobium senzhongii TaxID=2663859 RepID=A0A8I0EU98_9ACTN|nr:MULTISPECIES: DUF3043 domain-containing protein [Aeromicrobium]MBC9225493.1 DUF3043 domain-containing protein [Aeromicrobium senzhongii]MCQ3997603.1 DUF3043 domain-containing protein [Aeromicrobium sp. 636]MTB87529.1 DUF3043 domain-containing protein [Aeromicrobium senzhongii]QNL95429.1 DUF3043 domain-containing protein [Aeromicrobium senzhongii]
MNDAADPTPQRKSGPTRSRKEAEAARKAQMKRPLTRKEQAERERRRRAAARDKQRQALMGGGSTADLPARDRGPAKALARDAVDRRRTVAEFMLPILVVILVLSFFPSLASVVFSLWTVTIFATILDEVWLLITLKRELTKRFTKPERRGAMLYAVLRSTQIRRMRLPKPAIEVGQPLREHY